MKRKRLRYAKWGYIFCAPFVLGFLIFSLYPIIFTGVIGFTDFKGMGAVDFNFLEDPFQNFKTVLSNPSFKKAFGNTIHIWLFNFVPQIGLALLLTAWFTDKRYHIRGEGLFKVLFYMPNIITAATIAILFNALLGYPMGPVNDIFMRLGISKEPINFLVDKSVARGTVEFIQFWMWYGYTMIILISGVMGINPELFESAEVDGANRIQTFFYITIPNLKTILLFTLVTSLIGGLQMFEEPKLLFSGWASLGNGQTGGPGHTALTTVWKFFNDAFSQDSRLGYGSAMAYTLFVIIMLFSVVGFRLSRGKDGKGE